MPDWVIYVGGAVYTIFAIGVLVNIFKQTAFLIAIGWVYFFAALPLKFFEYINWSWWWIVIPPFALAFIWGRIAASSVE
jgi:hypothetical protein